MATTRAGSSRSACSVWCRTSRASGWRRSGGTGRSTRPIRACARSKRVEMPFPRYSGRVFSACNRIPRRAMASKKKRSAQAGAGAVAAGKAVKDNPYVQRLVEDEELRENLRAAYESVRKAYTRMSNGKGPVKALTEDKKTQKQLREAAS